MNKASRPKIEEALVTASLLSFTGGLLDAYSYLCRGHVFANAITGNMVLLGISFAQGQWNRGFSYLLAITAYGSGVFFANYLILANAERKRFSYFQLILLLEALLLIPLAFIPSGPWNFMLNAIISFVCAMQVQTFRRVHGHPFASTMCTGNLRSGTEALSKGVFYRDWQEAKKMIPYYHANTIFVLGACTGAILFHFISQYIILLASVILLGVMFLLRLHQQADCQ